MKKILTVVIILIVMIALINFVYIKYEENTLKKEMDNIISLNISKDEFDNELKTDNDYQKVEYAIKTYLINYKKTVNELDSFTKEEKIKTVLTADNYRVDGKEFTNTFNYLDTYKNNLKINLDKLKEISNKESINKYIEKEDVSNYYIDLYNKYLYGSNLYNQIKNNLSEYEEVVNNLNSLIDKEKEVLDYLKSNNNWVIRDDSIMFKSDEDMKKYQELTSILDNK